MRTYCQIGHVSKSLTAKADLSARLITDSKVTHLSFASSLSSSSLEVSDSFISAPIAILSLFSQAVHCVVDVALSSIQELLDMPLAPLRRVVRREIKVFRFHRERPEQFTILDTLECGHTFTDFQWGFLDLCNPHSEIASKKRHRCHSCAEAIAKREPRGVGLARQRRAA